MRKTVCLVFVSYILLIHTPIAQSVSPLPRRGLFVTVIQDSPVLSSREEIIRLIDFSKKTHIDSLFVQIYRSNKAWFPSTVGDSEPYRSSFKSVGEDPFAFLIKEAHASGIQVHAWLNLLSLGDNVNAPLLQKYGTDILTKNLKDKETLQDFKIDNQYFLEPGDPRVREELSHMVEEILNGYRDLDGIQLDYIRYPDKNPAYGFTKMNVKRFKESTGLQVIEEKSDAWKNWKRSQVTNLVELLTKKARALHPHLQVSTTGCMSYSRAHDEAFQDWPFWIKSGLVDFVTIMSYTKDTQTFEEYIEEAKNQTDDFFKKVNIGIGAYELTSLPETFEKQFEVCQNAGGRACVIFHYGNFLENPALKNSLLK